ncbi:MAG: VacJ family lipoprotein [Bdellovibrionota bacterium]|nr:MAG: VacJ family lipoprotein [Bdellovibrionota bacterium]
MGFREVVFVLAVVCAIDASADEIPWDPFEPVNRKIYWFNDNVDRAVIEPVAKGYRDIVPDPIKEMVNNFFENLRYPVYLVSDVAQLKFDQVGEHTARFMLNSTLGVGGLFDVAARHGHEVHVEDTGTALAYWGMPAGPYLVLPFLGPSNVRDALGLLADNFLNPLYWVAYKSDDAGTSDRVAYGSTALRVIHSRYELLDAVETTREGSLDPYTFIQSSYYQYREGLVYDGEPPLGEEDEFEITEE